MWQAKPLLKKNRIRELIDPSLGDAFDTRQMNLVLLVASLCIHQSSIRRPSMRQACSFLVYLVYVSCFSVYIYYNCLSFEIV